MRCAVRYVRGALVFVITFAFWISSQALAENTCPAVSNIKVCGQLEPIKIVPYASSFAFKYPFFAAQGDYGIPATSRSNVILLENCKPLGPGHSIVTGKQIGRASCRERV